MTEKKLHLRIIAVERKLYEGEVDQVQVTTSEGEMGVLPGHIPYMANLKPGPITVYNSGEITDIAAGGGFLEVANDEVTVLVDLAEVAEEIQEERAEEARREAEKTMKSAPPGSYEHTQAAAEWMRAQTRLSVVQRRKRRKT
jgi:F-type H+-transporting ATPase subunit epsilon